jgi:hypothetical protein
MRVLRMDRLEQQVGELIQANIELHARLESIQKGKDMADQKPPGVMATTKFHNLMVVG